MIAWMRKRPFIAALAVLALLLGGSIALELVFGTHPGNLPAEAPRAAASPDARILPPVIAQAPEQAYPELAARPLWVPTRRPAPVDTAAGKAALVRGQFVLQGVIVVGDQRTALLKEKTSGKMHRVDRGSDINGVTVEKIDPTEVTLTVGGERENVALAVQRADGKAAAPAAAAGAAMGPFAPQAAPATAAAPEALQAGQPATAPASAVPVPPAQAARQAPVANPANPATPAGTPNAQPMTPEELLARRRARRNQPTQ